MAQAAGVDTEVHRVADADVPAAIVRLVAAAAARQVAVESAVAIARSEVSDALRESGVLVVAPPGPIGAVADCEAGVSLAAFGVAETGSVALAAVEPTDRLVGMLTTLHLVLLRESDLLPDLDAAGERLAAWARPPVAQPYVSLITGASRTSDIERVLTIGVHGPRALHVLLVADQ